MRALSADVPREIAQMVRSNGLTVELCSIPRAAQFGWRAQLDPGAWVRPLNSWLRTYAAQRHFRLIDYYPLLAGPSGQFRVDLSNEGVHPNRSGYRLMRSTFAKEVLRPDR
jgi:hypothetical protein